MFKNILSAVRIILQKGNFYPLHKVLDSSFGTWTRENESCWVLSVDLRQHSTQTVNEPQATAMHSTLK